MAAMPFTRAALLTLVAGALGLPTLFFAFPSFQFSLATTGWKVATAALMVIALRRYEGRVTWRSVGIAPALPRPRQDRALPALLSVAAMMTTTFFWSSIPLIGRSASATSASTYGSPARMTGALLAYELVIRIPATVIAEESFFRGFLQQRVATAPPIVTGVLFGLYHLDQWRTIPSLIPFGVALGLLRWWLDSVWPGAVFHYLGDAMFVLTMH